MAFSKFLLENKENCKKIVEALADKYQFVSVLGTDVKGVVITSTKTQSQIGENTFDKQQGFVIKLTNGGAFFEYSFDNFQEGVENIIKHVEELTNINQKLKKLEVQTKPVFEEKLVKDYVRESDFDSYSNKQLLDFAKDLTKTMLSKSEHVVNAFTSITTQDISKLYVSKEKELTQNYTWVYGAMVAVYVDNDRMSQPREVCYSNKLADVLKELPTKVDHVLYLGDRLVHAGKIEPGFYDVVTDPSISGLIAHEAFGHGVEMDQFVKDRALAKKMVGEYVASPIVNMKDGANSAFSTASYFFDDDGVLAGDTQIIKDGILVNGISDLTSSRELDTTPTGNGRRESYKKKSYARMTNTFFEKGKDKFEDMIKSIKHGYLLCETNNGMEDPKNWAIQCVCEYGIEIVDGKLTENYVSPVVMSGFVPDLLKSITMVSDEFKVIGAGSCGKGYKEWVRVSDGGPHLKAKVKLS